MIDTSYAYDCRLINPTKEEIAYNLRIGALCANARNRNWLLEDRFDYWMGLAETHRLPFYRIHPRPPSTNVAYSVMCIAGFVDGWGNAHYRIRSNRVERDGSGALLRMPEFKVGRPIDYLRCLYNELEIWGFGRLYDSYFNRENTKELLKMAQHIEDDPLDPLRWLTFADALDEQQGEADKHNERIFLYLPSHIRWVWDRRLLNVKG